MKKILRLSKVFIVTLFVTSLLSSCGMFDEGDGGYEYGKAVVKITSQYNNLELQAAYSQYGLISAFLIKENGVVRDSYTIEYFQAYVRVSALAGDHVGEIREIYYDNLGKAVMLKEGFTTIRQFEYNMSNFLQQEVNYSTSSPLVEYSYDSNTLSRIVQYDSNGDELLQQDMEDHDIQLTYKTVGLIYLDLMYNPYGNYRPLLSLIGIAGTLPTKFAGEIGKFSGFQFDAEGYITELIMNVDGHSYNVRFTYDDEID
ncbi:MAG: hypothetical protein PHT25_07105 [Bacteroidales bacterium]|nr:hypothetical protein [Bacteroidales bacterium]